MDSNADAMALLKVLSLLLPSMTYARFATSATAPGISRLMSLLPVIFLLPFLPWQFYSVHLRTISAFFLVWLAVFKLLLLSFGIGPLSPSLPLPTFLAISSLPVKLGGANPRPSSSPGLLLPSAIKLVIFPLIVSLYQYKSQFHPYLLTALYCLHIYLVLDLILACTAFLVRVFLGLEVDPQFDAPLKSISLQDFWGRRYLYV